MINEGYLLGLDIGSSSVKASLISIGSGKTVVSAQSPKEEMPMLALQPGWAEQDPELWWQHAIISTEECLVKSNAKPEEVQAIGVAYQMHGLVVVDRDQKPLRNSIIWCDSRAVSIGDHAFNDLGERYSLEHLLNSPGNFTASKLKWVQEHEPWIYEKIHKFMLPGDYIAMKMSGDIATTATGLSEGIIWDYHSKAISNKLLSLYNIDSNLVAPVVDVFSVHSVLSKAGAQAMGLIAGTKISYRAGDQPNNAFSLNVLHPGETAATAGTSGVIYSVTDQPAFDEESRVNAFLHVNNTASVPRNGVLLCVNGTGIQNSWLRKAAGNRGSHYGYDEINQLASTVPVGSGGVHVIPFGNGAERILANKDIGASFHGINFNTHSQAHLFRAAQEGIVFALKYGFDILGSMGVRTSVIKAGNANMFLSPVFREAFANTIGARVELYDTDGAKGAALGAGIGAGIFSSSADAFKGLNMIGVEETNPEKIESYASAYHLWKHTLTKVIN